MAFFFFLCCLIAAANGVYAAEEPQYAAYWNFNDGAEGWSDTHSMTTPVVADGCLISSVTGEDPYLIGPMKTFDATASKIIEIRVRSVGPRSLSVYFASNENMGFTGEKHAGFVILGDDKFHVYTLNMAEKSALWSGQIRRIRFDWDTYPLESKPKVEIDWIRIPVQGLSLSPSFVEYPGLPVRVGESFQVTAEILNDGGADNKNVQYELKAGSRPVGKSTTKIQAGSAERFKETGVTFDAPGTYPLTLRAMDDSGRSYEDSVPIVVVPANFEPPSKPFSILDRGHVVACKDDVRLWLIRDAKADSFQRAILETRGKKNWEQACWFSPLPEVVLDSSSTFRGETLLWKDATAKKSSKGFTLEATALDSVGREWTTDCSLRFESGKALNLAASLRCSQSADILRFGFPRIQAGRGGFGSSKDEAIFPGLEWLAGDEISSSTLDSHLPLSLRRYPHPYKATLPVMSLRSDSITLSLHWDPLHSDGKDSSWVPQPEFQSPEKDRAYHIMGLSLPSVGQGLGENERLASEPMPISAENPVTLRATLAVDFCNDALLPLKSHVRSIVEDLEKRWPRTFDQEREFCRTYWTKTRWDAETKSWFDPWDKPNYFDPEIIQMLVLDRALGLSPEADSELKLFIESLIEAKFTKYGQGAAGASACFALGGVLEALGGERNRMNSFITSQPPDGGWRFSPTKQTVDLGKPGDEGIGLSASHALALLRFARVTGATDTLQSGIRCLEYMKRFRVPTAAQVWEIPVHSPDILASAQACLAYLEGYRISGEKEYLDLARYWAETGLPFIYGWNVQGKDFMRGATIPIIGSTFYVFGWYGQPVQWCGLAYAEAMLQFAECDDSLPWSQIAESITVSGMHQQLTDGPYAGCYPDFRNVITDQTALHLDPKIIIKNLMALRGLKAYLQTTVLKVSESKEHRISSFATIEKPRWNSKNSEIDFHVKQSLSVPIFILVTQIDQAPMQVKAHGKALSATKDPRGRGYRYNAETGWLVLQLDAGETGEVTIQQR